MIHFNFRPGDLSIDLNKAVWPPFVVVNVRNSSGSHVVPLTYQLSPHPKLEGVVCLSDVPCHGYYRMPPPGADMCICSQVRQRQEEREMGSSSTFGGRSNYKQVQKQFMVDKSKLPCRHLIKGTCNAAKCNFLHTEDALAAASMVKCQLKTLCEKWTSESLSPLPHSLSSARTTVRRSHDGTGPRLRVRCHC